MSRRNVGSTPCEIFACKHFMECALQLKACKSFYVYVHTGRVLPPSKINEPTTAWYERVMTT